MATCDYSSIAKHYELWCMGDEDYVPAAEFYLYAVSHDRAYFE
jgi:hypothetical protein